MPNRVGTIREFVPKHQTKEPLGWISYSGIWEYSLGPSPSPDHLPPRVLDEYALVYTTGGEGRYFDAAGRKATLRPGDVHLLFPGVPHCYGPKPTSHWDEFWIQFDGPVFRLWQAEGLLNSDRPFYHIEPVSMWLSRFIEAVTPPQLSQLDRPLNRVCKFQELLSAVVQGAPSLKLMADELWVREALAAIDAYGLDKAIDWEAVAGTVGTSYQYFRKRFSRLTGVGPNEHHKKQQIALASHYLKLRPDLEIKRISALCGFSSVAHFTNRFRQATGSSPASFRRQATLP